MRILWAATSLVVVEAVALFVLIGTDRSRGAWGFVAPCLFMLVLLSRYHETPRQVALCNLAGVSAGLPILLIMALLPSRRSNGRATLGDQEINSAAPTRKSV